MHSASVGLSLIRKKIDKEEEEEKERRVVFFCFAFDLVTDSSNQYCSKMMEHSDIIKWKERERASVQE